MSLPRRFFAAEFVAAAYELARAPTTLHVSHYYRTDENGAVLISSDARKRCL